MSAPLPIEPLSAGKQSEPWPVPAQASRMAHSVLRSFVETNVIQLIFLDNN